MYRTSLKSSWKNRGRHNAGLRSTNSGPISIWMNFQHRQYPVFYNGFITDLFFPAPTGWRGLKGSPSRNGSEELSRGIWSQGDPRRETGIPHFKKKITGVIDDIQVPEKGYPGADAGNHGNRAGWVYAIPYQMQTEIRRFWFQEGGEKGGGRRYPPIKPAKSGRNKNRE